MWQDVGPVDRGGGQPGPEQQPGHGQVGLELWPLVLVSLELHCGPAWPNLTSDPIMLLTRDTPDPAPRATPLGAWPPHSGQRSAPNCPATCAPERDPAPTRPGCGGSRRPAPHAPRPAPPPRGLAPPSQQVFIEHLPCVCRGLWGPVWRTRPHTRGADQGVHTGPAALGARLGQGTGGLFASAPPGAPHAGSRAWC